MIEAKATFEVTAWEPQNWSFEAMDPTAVNQTRVVKEFLGDLEGVGEAQLLTVQSNEGDATYVAMERITGTLHGKQGSFALGHSATIENHERVAGMVVIVPSSGTGELVGIRGDGEFRIDPDGGHHLTLQYQLP